MKTVAAIVGIVVLEGIALYQGVDGAMLSTVVAILAALGGYEIGKGKSSVQNEQRKES